MSPRKWLAAVLALVAVGAAAGAAIAAVPAWTTYRHDASRSGIDPDSTSPLPPAQIWQTPALDGPIWGQPLVYGGNVYVATENDTVYALNAGSGAVVWQRHLATPVPSGQLSCGDISPNVGITSTPVIDPGTGRIYVVGDTWNGSSIAHEMYGLNLADGSIGVGPVSVEPPGDTPKDQLQRASLALDAGKIIVGYGGNDGDCGSYHGWLAAVPEAGGSLQSYEVDSGSGHSRGAIWGSGNAPAVDSAGDLWISTGNGNSGSSFDFSESVIKLDSNLNRLDYWAPSNWSSLDSSDTDLGSSMPVLLPGGLVFEIGKAGVGYLLNASNLGQIGGEVYSHSVCAGSWGGAIYVGGVIYATCSDGLHALALNAAARTFTPLSGWSVNSSASGPPIYAGGLVWAASSGVGTDNGTLYALDPNSGATRFSANLGGFEHFTIPSAGGDRLFVADDSKVTAFQIANPPGPTATTLALTTSKNPVRAGQPVTYTATVSPAPDAGTVGFSRDGAAVPGCTGVAVSGGQASCTTRFTYARRYRIGASYSGDTFFVGSSSALTQSVTTTTPVISHVRVRVVRRRLRINLVLSEPAQVTVLVSKLVPGRRVRRSCRAGARHGRHCTAALRRTTLRLSGHRGRNAFRPRMRALPPGRYLLILTALTPAGGRSRPHTAVVLVRG